jgi:hypothetical protein
MNNQTKLLILTIIILGVLSFNKFPLKVPDNQDDYIKIELYFGMNKTDGGKVSEAQWESFADTVISKVFSKGATITKSDGRWLSGDSLIKEESRVVTYFSRLYEMTDEFSDNIDMIREKYKLYYFQEAVLRTDEYITASF